MSNSNHLRLQLLNLTTCSLKIVVIPSDPVIFIMDNACIHKHVDEIDLVTQHAVKYLPPYSPIFNPIEEMFNETKSFAKQYLQSHKNYLYYRPENLPMMIHKMNILKAAVYLVMDSISAVNCAIYDQHQTFFMPQALKDL